MGCCISASKHNDINDSDVAMKKRRSKQVRVLLLGASESGKSTLLKQFILIYSDGFREDERSKYKDIVLNNITESLSKYNIHSNMQTLLNNQAIKKLRNENQLINDDSLLYYLDHIDRISKPDYIPIDQDILRLNIKTKIISETKFKISKLNYKIIDIGGQRSERKNWIHCFKDIQVILFMVNMSEYDQVLIEDEKINRMTESLVLFESICNMPHFKNTAIVLLMNRVDIFKQKLLLHPLKDYFPKYKGDNTFENASQFLLQQFQQITISNSKKIYTHFISAIDTAQIKTTTTSINNIVLQNSLRSDQLL